MNIKKLKISLYSSGGRNNKGRICVRHRGGGVKKKYHILDFIRVIKDGCPGIIRFIEKDAVRNSLICLIFYRNGFLKYEILTETLSVGDLIRCGEFVNIKIGNSLPLKKIPLGLLIHNLEFFFERGSQLCRAAGVFGKLIKHFNDKYAVIELSSGEQRLIDSRSYATIGIVSNGIIQNKKLYKAGQKRWLGRRPKVRGEAMNPVDHPHGGATSGGRFCMTPSGALTRGVKTRNNSKKIKSKNLIFKKKKCL